MKKLIASLLMVVGVSAAFAQGTVTFNTFNGGNSGLGQTFLAGTTTGPGPSYVGQLWWSDTAGGTFVAAGTPQAFDNVAPSYVLDGSVAIPGHQPGTPVFIQMRVWNLSAGPDWASANSGGLLAQYGITEAKSRGLGGVDSDNNPFAPQPFNTFANMTLTAVPEPSTMVLAGLGLASLLIFRRRK